MSANISKDLYYLLQQHTPSTKTVRMEDYLDPELLGLTMEELDNTKVNASNFGEILFMKKIRQYCNEHNVTFASLSPKDKTALIQLRQKIPLCQSITIAEDVNL